jgi:glycosyltransferase involved in cell wall biosynthesis
VRYAGSERVLAELARTFEVAAVVTTLVRPEALPEPIRHARPSSLQRLPGATRHHEALLPLMPLAWRLRKPIDCVDAVVSSSHACAKAVRVAPGVPHVCYCHTPMRYAWNFSAEAARLPRPARPLAARAMSLFRAWDRATARRVTRFVANSTAVAERIRQFYGRDAEVVHPPVRTDYFTPGDDSPAQAFLYVGRLVAYKRPDLVVEAFRDVPERLLVVGDGHLRAALERDAPANVTFLGEVDDTRLRDLYRGAIALVYPAEEDFGIVMAEAQACGTPVIGLRLGGAVDIVSDGETGVLVDRQDAAELRRAVRELCGWSPDRRAISARAQRFSAARFRAEMRRVVEDAINRV